MKRGSLIIVLGLVLIGIFAILGFSGILTGNVSEGVQVCECSSCSECIQKMDDASCDEIRLTQDINSKGDCITNLVNFHDKTFDCQGHKISGSGVGAGIYLHNAFDSIIKNCEVSGFNYGVRVYEGLNNEFRNIRACENNYDVYVKESGGKPKTKFVDMTCDTSSKPVCPNTC